MSINTLTKTEARLLTDAAGREHGLLVLPRTMKATTAQRLIDKLIKNGVVVARGENGTTDHHLTPGGYRAIGRKPPREPGTKQALILDLLGRGEGASLDELIAATGWLPHTTRAALSRLRSGGQALVKSARPDGRTAYRIVMDEPESEPKAKRVRAARRSPDRVEAVA